MKLGTCEYGELVRRRYWCSWRNSEATILVLTLVILRSWRNSEATILVLTLVILRSLSLKV